MRPCHTYTTTNTGISAMRKTVMRIGVFMRRQDVGRSGHSNWLASFDVQRRVDLFGKATADARYLRDLFATRASKRRDATEVSQQFATPLRTDAGDAVEFRLTSRLAASRADGP